MTAESKLHNKATPAVPYGSEAGGGSSCTEPQLSVQGTATGLSRRARFRSSSLTNHTTTLGALVPRCPPWGNLSLPLWSPSGERAEPGGASWGSNL